MENQQQQKILRAFQLVLRPVIKILLKYGIGYSEFAETVKTAFVDVGSSEFGIRGRPTNISRIAVMTGLTRKEVRRLRTKLESGNESIAIKSTPMTEILTRWHAEDEFLDKSGRPAPLPFDGIKESFTSLVKKFGGDVPPGAMRTELKRVGSVEEDTNGMLAIAKRSFFSSDQTDHILTALVHGAYPLLANIEHNIGQEDSGNAFARYAVHSVNIQEINVKKLQRMCRDRIADMAESFDDMFIAYESIGSDSASKSKSKPVMVGLYYFEEKDSNAKYEW